MRKIFERIFRRNKKRKDVVSNDENEIVLKVAQEQLKELAKRGLSIPVFTL